MLNKLTNCYIDTHIAELPSIINDNNEKIKNEFSFIYNSSLNRLNKSIYDPVGYVNSYFGDFDNLQTEYITVKNSSSFKDSIYNNSVKIIGQHLSPHNDYTDRFSSSTAEEKYQDEYVHDSSIIVYNDNMTLYERIQDISNGNVFIADCSLKTKYSGKDISEIINWKSKLQVASVTIVDDTSTVKTYKVICDSIIEN